jgi:hypothetical protein
MAIYTAAGREFDLRDFERFPELVTLVKAGVPVSIPVMHI